MDTAWSATKSRVALFVTVAFIVRLCQRRAAPRRAPRARTLAPALHAKARFAFRFQSIKGELILQSPCAAQREHPPVTQASEDRVLKRRGFSSLDEEVPSKRKAVPSTDAGDNE